MTLDEGPDARETTAALRGGSLVRLQEGFRRHVEAASSRAVSFGWVKEMAWRLRTALARIS